MKPECPKCGFKGETPEDVYKHNSKEHPNMINFVILEKFD